MKNKIINKIKVAEFGGVRNQFEITTPDGRYFQFYNTIIAFKPADGGPTVLDSGSWDYSRTTGKYRNLFLGEGKAATEQKIKNGFYKLANLNA